MTRKPPVSCFEGWAKLTARYLIDHTEEIGVNNPNDLNFVKKVGRVLVQRALLTSLRDGPHARRNETSSDRLTYTDDYRTWTGDMLDYIFQLGEMAMDAPTCACLDS